MELLNLSNYTVRQLRQITQKDEAFLLVLNFLFFLWLSIKGKEDDIEGFYFKVPEFRISSDEIIHDLERGFKELQRENPELDKFFDDTIYFLSKHHRNQVLAEVLLTFFRSLFDLSDITETIKKEEEFSIFFDKFITENFPKGHFPTPRNLTELLVKIANPDLEERVYCPNVREGNILSEINKNIDRNLMEIFAQEQYTLSYKVAFINNIVNGGYNVTLKNESPLFLFREELLNRFDLTISVPPFGQKLSGDNKNIVKQNLRHSPLKVITTDDAYLQLMLNSLNDNGRMITIVPEGILTNERYKYLRQYYINKDWIETIISLPTNTFAPDSRIKTSILVINKNKHIQSRGKILFIRTKDTQKLSEQVNEEINSIYQKWRKNGVYLAEQSENYIQSEILLPDNLQKRSLKLSAEIFAHPSYEELQNILANTKYEVKKINDFVSKISTGLSPNFTASRKRREENLKLVTSLFIPYVKSSDLSNLGGEKKLDIDKLEWIAPESLNSNKARLLIAEDVILINKIGKSLNTIYFKYEGIAIAINPNVFALHLKKDINPKFFVSQLSSKVVQLQFELQSIGTTINRISINELKNISIIVPPVSEQRRLILELDALKETKQKLQTTETQTRKEISETEFNVVATISHNLNQKLGQMVADIESLKDFLSRKNENQESISWTEPAAIVFADENSEDVDNLKELFTRLENTLGDATKTLKTTEEILQKDKVNLEKINLLTFFKDIKKSFTGNNFIIELRGKKLDIELDRAAFKDAIRNLISNAKKHGFRDTSREYCIVFDWNQFTDENTGDKKVRISYQNDGEPFPKDFSFEEYIKLTGRAGKNRGSGLGGFWINKVVQLHDGIFQQVELAEDRQINSIHFEIILPIKQKYIWI